MASPREVIGGMSLESLRLSAAALGGACYRSIRGAVTEPIYAGRHEQVAVLEARAAWRMALEIERRIGGNR